MLERALAKRHGAELELELRLARRERVGFEEGTLACGSEELVEFQGEEGKSEVLIREDVVKEGTQTLICEVVV